MFKCFDPPNAQKLLKIVHNSHEKQDILKQIEFFEFCVKWRLSLNIKLELMFEKSTVYRAHLRLNLLISYQTKENFRKTCSAENVWNFDFYG